MDIALNANELSVQLHEIDALHESCSLEKRVKKISLALTTFEHYIPNLSLLSDLFKLIYKQVNDAVFSGQYSCNEKKDVEKLPYFVLYTRLLSQRNKEVENVQDLLDDKVDELQVKSSEVVQKKIIIGDLQSKIKELNFQVSKLEKRLQKEEHETQRLNDITTKLNSENKIIQQEKDNLEKKSCEELEMLNLHTRQLQTFEDEKNQLSKGFINVLCENGSFDKHQKQTNLKIDEHVDCVDNIMLNLNEMRQRLLNEFNIFLHKRMLETTSKHNQDHTETKENDKGTQKLILTKQLFLQNMKLIQGEISLLEEQQHFITINQSKDAHNDDKNIQDALFHVSNGNTHNPFVPQNEIINKYSFMFYASINEGRTFAELPGATFCPICSEMNIICPHKSCLEELILKLPHSCNSIKITRPFITQRSNRRNNSEIIPASKGEGTTEDYWLWYYKLYEVPPKPHGEMTLEHLMDLVHEFYAFMFFDDNDLSEGNSTNFMGLLVRFLHERYSKDEVVHMVLYDMLMTAEKYTSISLEVKLFLTCCNEVLDASICRYCYLLADLIVQAGIQNINDLINFLATVYHFLSEDELEVLKIGYISFSNNHMDEKILFHYILHITIQMKEPRLHDSLSVIRSYPHRYDGLMNDIEFVETIEKLTYITPMTLSKKLFTNALSHRVNKEYLDLHTASHILCYLGLKEEYSKLKLDLRKNRQTFKDSRKSSEASHVYGYDHLKLYYFEFERRRYVNLKLL